MTRIAAAVPLAEPSENPRIALGGNRPPLDVEARAAFDDILDGKAGFRQRIKDLLGSADRAVATDEETAGKCGELVKQLRAASTFIEGAHKESKEPYLLAGRAIDGAKNELIGPLAAAKVKVEGKQTQFLREEDARRQAEARRKWEAEQAQRRAEDEARRAAEPTALVTDPALIADLPAPEPERQIIRGDFGAAVSGKKEFVATVRDYEVAFIAVADNVNVRAAIDKAVSALVRGGVRKIEGVDVIEQLKVSNR
jgi:hypothetical protein